MAVTFQRMRGKGLALLAWTLLALSYTLAMMGYARLHGEAMTWGVAAVYNLICCYSWMALSAVPFLLGRWVGFEARQWRQALAVHLPAAVVLGLIHHVFLHVVYWPWGSPLLTLGVPLATALREGLPWNLHEGIVFYSLILLFAYAAHHLRRGEAERSARSELEAQLATAQLQALRMQLRPHFLFNTLNAVSALVLEDPLLAKAMIAKLGEFLRLTLEAQHSPEVPLRQELRFLRGYLDIQQLRFQDRLTVKVDAAEDTLDLPVPHLVLQPLVENALQHGLASRPGPATLEVRTRREGGLLLLEVEDDGLGLPTALREGVGLSNTRARLRARHGSAASLELSSRPEGGVLAALRLPLQAESAL